MITEFFDMLSQESFFSQSFATSSYSCLTQALSTLVFLLDGIVCLEACWIDSDKILNFIYLL